MDMIANQREVNDMHFKVFGPSRTPLKGFENMLSSERSESWLQFMRDLQWLSEVHFRSCHMINGARAVWPSRFFTLSTPTVGAFGSTGTGRAASAGRLLFCHPARL